MANYVLKEIILSKTYKRNVSTLGTGSKKIKSNTYRAEEWPQWGKMHLILLRLDATGKSGVCGGQHPLRGKGRG